LFRLIISALNPSYLHNHIQIAINTVRKMKIIVALTLTAFIFYSAFAVNIPRADTAFKEATIAVGDLVFVGELGTSHFTLGLQCPLQRPIVFTISPPLAFTVPPSTAGTEVGHGGRCTPGKGQCHDPGDGCYYCGGCNQFSAFCQNPNGNVCICHS
jgi:hypothetical protein